MSLSFPSPVGPGGLFPDRDPILLPDGSLAYPEIGPAALNPENDPEFFPPSRSSSSSSRSPAPSPSPTSSAAPLNPLRFSPAPSPSPTGSAASTNPFFFSPTPQRTLFFGTQPACNLLHRGVCVCDPYDLTHIATKTHVLRRFQEALKLPLTAWKVNKCAGCICPIACPDVHLGEPFALNTVDQLRAMTEAVQQMWTITANP